MIFAVCGGILLAVFVLRLLRLIPYILVILFALYVIGSLTH